MCLQVRTVPDSIRRGRWNVDSEFSRKFFNLNSEQQRCVWHLLNLLFDVLIFCSLLEVFGFSNFVYKSQNPPASSTTSQTTVEEKLRDVWHLDWVKHSIFLFDNMHEARRLNTAVSWI